MEKTNIDPRRWLDLLHCGFYKRPAAGRLRMWCGKQRPARMVVSQCAGKESFMGSGAGLQIMESLVPLGGPGSLAKVWQHELSRHKNSLSTRQFSCRKSQYYSISSQHYWVMERGHANELDASCHSYDFARRFFLLQQMGRKENRQEEKNGTESIPSPAYTTV